jgi:hypothetical protein
LVQPSTTTRRATRPATTCEVVAGRYRTRAAADKRVTALSNKNLTGFAVESENRGFHVERSSASKTAATTELRAVRPKGFHASLEIERAGSHE